MHACKIAVEITYILYAYYCLDILAGHAMHKFYVRDIIINISCKVFMWHQIGRQKKFIHCIIWKVGAQWNRYTKTVVKC